MRVGVGFVGVVWRPARGLRLRAGRAVMLQSLRRLAVGGGEFVSGARVPRGALRTLLVGAGDWLVRFLVGPACPGSSSGCLVLPRLSLFLSPGTVVVWGFVCLCGRCFGGFGLRSGGPGVGRLSNSLSFFPVMAMFAPTGEVPAVER